MNNYLVELLAEEPYVNVKALPAGQSAAAESFVAQSSSGHIVLDQAGLRKLLESIEAQPGLHAEATPNKKTSGLAALIEGILNWFKRDKGARTQAFTLASKPSSNKLAKTESSVPSRAPQESVKVALLASEPFLQLEPASSDPDLDSRPDEAGYLILDQEKTTVFRQALRDKIDCASGHKLDEGKMIATLAKAVNQWLETGKCDGKKLYVYMDANLKCVVLPPGASFPQGERPPYMVSIKMPATKSMIINDEELIKAAKSLANQYNQEHAKTPLKEYLAISGIREQWVAIYKGREDGDYDFVQATPASAKQRILESVKHRIGMEGGGEVVCVPGPSRDGFPDVLEGEAVVDGDLEVLFVPELNLPSRLREDGKTALTKAHEETFRRAL